MLRLCKIGASHWFTPRTSAHDWTDPQTRSSSSEVIVLMHQGIGLDRFNTISRGRAVHALFECCCNVTWAAKIADARPFPDRDALLAKADVELLALSQPDLDRAFDAVVHEQFSRRSVTELARITRARIDSMLGPTDGYPAY
jgi:2-oxo-4-hydroxy-4-carboxy-5-ureidoimidazoline decarboxylase